MGIALALLETLTRNQLPRFAIPRREGGITLVGMLDHRQVEAIGQGHRGHTGRLGVGQCTINYDCCVEGCPPSEKMIYEELKAYMDELKKLEQMF